MAVTRFGLLGPFAVELDGVPCDPTTLGNRKARLLLKLLLARHGRHVAMDTIIDVLWGERPPAKPIENVASLVSRLRAALGRELIDGGRSGYRLIVPADCSVDIADAEALVDEAERRLAAGQPALANTAAEQALSVLEVGVPFEDEVAEGEWRDEIRHHVDRLLRRARVTCWQALGAMDEHREALAVAQRAAVTDPLDEEAHRAVIASYHQLGEPGEALAAYERLRTVLVEELGTGPGPRTEALYAAVLHGETSVDEPGRAAAHPSTSHLVGRDPEMQKLLGHWQDAASGRPTCVVIAGESGIGKTELARALAREATATGAVAVEARCYESERSLFLQPIVETLRHLVTTLPPDLVARAAGDAAGVLATLVPEIGQVTEAGDVPPLTAEMQRRRTFEAIASFLSVISSHRPLLIVLDDLHRAGASTSELAQFVRRWDRSARLMFVATVSGEHRAPIEPPLGADAITCELGPLPELAVVALATEAGHQGLGAELYRMTRGHPLFVVEALGAIPADGSDVVIPESLRSAVTGRVARCGDDVEEFLRAAVVAGTVFEVDQVGELLGLDPEEAVRRAETALRGGLISELGKGYQFANDIIRSILYDTTPAPTRVVRHRRLAAMSTDRPQAAGDHAAAAGDWEPAIDHWLDAASRSLASFANREAEELLTRALDACAVIGDPARTARVQQLRGRARLAQARYEAAAEDLAAAQALARATDDHRLEATTLELLAWCAYHARQIDRATAFSDRLRRHPAAGPGARLLDGRLCSARGELTDAIETLHALIDETDDPVARASALSYLGTALAHSDRYHEAIEVLDDAVGRCQVAGVLRSMLGATFFGAIARANLGDLGGALDLVARMAGDVERYDHPAYRPRASNIRAWLWRELGDPGRSHDLAEEALETTHLPDGSTETEAAAHARLQLAETALALGEETEAIGWLDALSAPELDAVAFNWRIELHRLALLARLNRDRAEELSTLAASYGSLKYQAIALALLGRRDEAMEVASATRSTLLMATVGPPEVAEQAAHRLAGTLAPDDRTRFVERGGWRVSTEPVSARPPRR